MASSHIANDLAEKIQIYREQRLTGLVTIKGQSSQWLAYYLLGRITWIESRIHSLRRWQRHLAVQSPAFFEQINQPIKPHYESWNYAALARLVKLEQFPYDQLCQVIEGCLAEDIFDILQVGSAQAQKFGQALTYEVSPKEAARYGKEAASLPFIMIHHDRVWQSAQKNWQDWKNEGLAAFSPDWAPVITQLAAFKAQTPLPLFQTLAALIDGKNTLRDLAIQTDQPLISLTKLILPAVSQQLLKLIEVPDIAENANHGFRPELFDGGRMTVSQPIRSPARPAKSAPEKSVPVRPVPVKPVLVKPVPVKPVLQKQALVRQTASNAPKIIYIDDSPIDSQLMAEIVESLGYQYINISDSIQALPLLLELRPELIFLDLVMPIANGYEVCAQIRRISIFKKIPVIIVTGNDGITDRIRARMVGASGFLGKPIQLQKVKRVMEKHLPILESPSRHSAQRGGVLSSL
ncbi:MAG: response regulator [Phormidesmis sp.]